MIAYKGTDKDMKCRGFQYELGKVYETAAAECCKNGFHACEYPLDVLKYYPPDSSRYFVVEQGGEISKDDDDSKQASTQIELKAEIGITELVETAVRYTKERATEGSGGRATGYQGAASATGRDGVALAAGYQCKAMGAEGCVICCVERGDWDGGTYPILAAKAAIVDGETIKAGTWYTLKDGEFVEVGADE